MNNLNSVCNLIVAKPKIYKPKKHVTKINKLETTLKKKKSHLYKLSQKRRDKL